MLSRLRVLLCVSFLILSASASRAGDNDFLRHTKFFYICSIKRECTDCNDCSKQRYLVKIQNRLDKKIKSISYCFYSDVYNKLITKEAKIEGDRIDPRSVGLTHLCVPNGLHWTITAVEYTDGSSENFKLNERLENFNQEPDECDCND